MTNLELLKEFVKEINKDWLSNYRAKFENNVLIVEYETYDENNNSKWVEAGWINSDLDFGGDDEDIVEQLEYMINR